MLIFDKSYALLIAIVFGLAGLPWAFWLFRKEKGTGLFEKTIIGYTIGIVAVPLMFLLEFILGILYEPTFIYVNWAIVFLSGAYFAFKDKAYKFEFDFTEVFTQINLAKLAVFAIMLASFVIGFSVSGTPIMDLDPYFYLDGVRQVVYEGHNFANDMTAWYPMEISSHMGQPIWKYMLASWFSVYNGDVAYSPYALIGVGSIFPPIIGALSAFFMYFLFKHLYNYRVGLLGAGLLAFLPTMMIKFQGGDFQIEPYNIFAFVFLMGALAYALKKNTKESWIFMLVSAICAFLGSNLATLVLFVFSLSIFAVGISQFVLPTQEGEKHQKTLAYFVGAVVLCQVIMLFTNVRAGNDVFGVIRGVMPYVLIPFGAFGSAWVITKLLSDRKQKDDAHIDVWENEIGKIKKKIGLDKLKLDLWSRIGVLGVIAIIGLFMAMFAQHIPVVDSVAKAYILFGAYTEPLYRTIAEQAPGSEYYNGQLGFLAAPFSQIENAQGMLGGAYNLGMSVIGALNAIPNALVNLVYGIFIAFMNGISGFDTFQKVEKGNSMLTLVVFWGILGLGASILYSIYKKRQIGLDALLILPFSIPVVLMAFGKAKLVMYLALAVVFLACALWANIERIARFGFRAYYSGASQKTEKEEEKKKIADEQNLYSRVLKYGAIGAVLFIVLLQFAPGHILSATVPGAETTNGLYTQIANNYGFGALPLLMGSFTPRIYDDSQRVLVKLERYCALNSADPVCQKVYNWENTKNDPVQYYEPNLCARSLWPYSDKQPTLAIQAAFSYRCSMVAGYWLDVMEWMRESVPKDESGSRIMSWWDYGHWTNYLGETNTVLRNEHGSTEMIGKTAYSFLHADVKFLRDAMREYDSKYLLVDIEILGSGNSKDQINLGGKYSALNYLGCAWANLTSVEKWPGQSQCENEHLWETVVIPQQEGVGGDPCVVSANRGISGLIGYRINRQLDGTGVPQAEYCFVQEYESGNQVLRAYSLKDVDESGDLRYVDARWGGYAEATGIVLTAFYDGEVPESANAFYHSNVYSAFFLNKLEGFDLVYSTPQIRMYKMKDEYWN